MNVPPQGQVGMQQGPQQQPQLGQQQPGQQQQQASQQNQQQQAQQQQAPQQSQQNQQQPGQPSSQQSQPGTPGSQAQQLQQQQQQQTQEKLDNISKVKSLIGPLKDHLAVALKSAAHLLHYNTMVDNGSSKGLDVVPPRLDVSLEAFYSTCDQIELHLKTAIECLNQGASSQRYLPLNVLPTRTEHQPGQEGLLYPQYLATVKAQIQFAKQMHDILIMAVQNLNAVE
ncbi:mediator of RNA polymerase II transcription subunit 29 [Frankliniella occidentalis]|uniref:Mediator of RNA polymerase II transcription subunit 29 n=1 Tax=Frankliniella occidentalis TaxID=133901 RepID=A0A6J1SLJ5_FRAOC|nr:mediator of RNA polymerase II transcription subunit 29 [Frankliniella occidentalis]